MNEKLIFLRRTQKEIEIFGGEVYIDINGRNVGVLGTTDFIYEVRHGIYKIKMYKSHTYDSFIGNAEAEISIIEGEQLLIKYSPPMLVNQSGNIIVTNFKSYSQLEHIVLEKDQKIISDDNYAKQKRMEEEEKSKNGVVIFIILMVISTIIYAFSIADIYSY